jgi:hypothetical protein
MPTTGFYLIGHTPHGEDRYPADGIIVDTSQPAPEPAGTLVDVAHLARHHFECEGWTQADVYAVEHDGTEQLLAMIAKGAS